MSKKSKSLLDDVHYAYQVVEAVIKENLVRWLPVSTKAKSPRPKAKKPRAKVAVRNGSRRAHSTTKGARNSSLPCRIRRKR
jgi:hypothetical protein